MFGSIALGTAAWYFLFSDFERFKTRNARSAGRLERPQILFGPGSISGRF
jgi:hypothetical protein